jgi:rhodanese-related sulfurtransferase
MTNVALLAATLAFAAPPLPPPGVIGGAAAQQLLASGAVLVDVRTPSEYEAGHVPGARLIPYDQIAARAGELPAKDRPIVLYCRTGRRTGIAAATLAQLGYTAVYDMQGLSNWPGALQAGPAR